MSSTEKIKMTLHIGGNQIAVTVPFENQEFVRRVESQVESLYTKWRHDFPMRSDREVLAMVAYQFANHYYEMQQRYSDANLKAQQCLDAIDRLENESPLAQKNATEN